MDNVLTANSPVLFLFLYLLPGFLGMVVYGFLVEGEPQNKFDRLVTAFVLSLLAALCVHGVFGVPVVPEMAVLTTTTFDAVLQAMVDRNLLYSSIAASFIAVLIAVLNNHGVIYEAVNRLKISYKTSNSDVWQDIFYRHRGFWLELEFTDGRTLVGWPKYFSATGKPRELFLADAVWSHMDENGEVISVEVLGPGVYISDLSSVIRVEILR